MILRTLHLSLAEYDAMVLKGAFDDLNRRVELIRGELVEMNLEGTDYRTHRIASGTETISPLIAPDTHLDLHDLFTGES